MARALPKPGRTVVPDRLDLRDRPYEPTVRSAPAASLRILDEVARVRGTQRMVSTRRLPWSAVDVTPILGMQRYFDDLPNMAAVTPFRAPGSKTESDDARWV